MTPVHLPPSQAMLAAERRAVLTAIREHQPLSFRDLQAFTGFRYGRLMRHLQALIAGLQVTQTDGEWRAL
jgi:predicted transcriptional regulator